MTGRALFPIENSYGSLSSIKNSEINKKGSLAQTLGSKSTCFWRIEKGAGKTTRWPFTRCNSSA